MRELMKAEYEEELIKAVIILVFQQLKVTLRHVSVRGSYGDLESRASIKAWLTLTLRHTQAQ